jgi:hypothetical protein
MGWAERNLHTLFGAPPGIQSPAAYDFSDQPTRHVIYLGGTDFSASTGILHELYSGPDDVWHDQDLHARSGGPLSSVPPAAYLFILEGTQHVLFQSTENDGHIWELYWDGDWHASDLTDNTGAPAAHHLTPLSGFEFVAGQAQVVVYEGSDFHVHALIRTSADDGDPHWVHRDLTHDLNGPLCTRGVTAYAFEDGMHIDFQSPDGRIREFSGGTHLTFTELSEVSAGLEVPADGSAVSRGYGFAADGTRRLPIVADNGEVWEYVFTDHWDLVKVSQALGAVSVQSATSVAGYAFPPTDAVPVATRHMVYSGVDGLIHEFWAESGDWHENPLTGSNSPRAAGSPSAFTDIPTSSQNVFYISAANEVVELRWTPGRFHVGGPVKVAGAMA